MQKFQRFAYMTVLVLVLLLFLTSCAKDENELDNNQIPEDFLGTWNIILIQNVDSTQIYPERSTNITFEITETEGQGAFVLKSDGMILNSCTVEWEVRDGVNYLLATDTEGESSELRIDSYDAYFCDAEVIDPIDGNKYWAMARGNGIFGTVRDDLSKEAITDAEVTILDNNGTEISTPKQTNDFGVYYLPAGDESSFPITVEVSAAEYCDYDFEILEAQDLPAHQHINMLLTSSANIPDDFEGAWNVMLMQDVGDCEIFPVSSNNVVLEVTETNGEGEYVFTYNGALVSNGTAEWEIRDGEDYLRLTDISDNEDSEMRIENYDHYFCDAVAIAEVENNMYWAMVRNNGIFGTVTDNTTFEVLGGAQVAVFDSDGLQVGETKTVNSYGAFYFPAVAPSSFPITVVATVSEYEDYIYTVESAQSSPTYVHMGMVMPGPRGTVSGTLIDTINDTRISGIDITVQIGNEYSTVSTNGFYTIANVPTGIYPITASAYGYLDYSGTIQIVEGINPFDIDLTPEEIQYDAVASIELFWNDNSSDLDLYTRTPDDEDVYYYNQGSLSEPPYLYHNGDHTVGPGPEVIDVCMLQSGTYHVFARDWSNLSFVSNGAYVVFKNENGEIIQSIYAEDATGSYGGEWWYIATFDDSAELFSIVNELSDYHPLDSGIPDTHVGTVSMAWTADGWDFDLICHTPTINGTDYYVSYDEQGSLSSSPYVYHTGDETSGPASENILISQVFSGNYYFYVETWDGSSNAGGCTSTIYDDEGTLLSNVDASNASGEGEIWVIGYMNGSTGTWNTINELRSVAPMMKYSTARRSPQNK